MVIFGVLSNREVLEISRMSDLGCPEIDQFGVHNQSRTCLDHKYTEYTLLEYTGPGPLRVSRRGQDGPGMLRRGPKGVLEWGPEGVP